MPTTPPQNPQLSSSNTKWIIWLIIIIAIIILFLLMKSCGNDDTSTTTTSNTNATTNPSSNANTNSATNTSSATNATSPTSTTSGPVARWTFNGDGSDATGNGHTASALGGAVYDGTLDGVDDGFSVANKADLNPANAITVSAWWNGVDFSGAGNNGLVDKGFTSHDAPYYQYHLGVTGTQYRGTGYFDFWVALDGTSKAAGSVVWTAGQWYHLVGTYDGKEVRLYVNGALASKAAATGTMTDYGKDLAIATFTNLRRSSTDFLPSEIDDVAIWDRAISEAEVKTLYSEGAE